MKRACSNSESVEASTSGSKAKKLATGPKAAAIKVSEDFCDEAKDYRAGTNTKVSLNHALTEFKLENPRHKNTMGLFDRFCQTYVCGEDCECEYGDDIDYTMNHSVDLALEKAEYFLTWFMDCKVMCSGNDKKKAATSMRALINFCIKRGWIEKDKKSKEELASILEISKSYGRQRSSRGNNECVLS
jgi:intergrase/recombinase